MVISKENEKRKVGDYTVLCAVNIGSREIILAEKEQSTNGERFLCCYAPMEPPLPPMCYSILPSTGEVIQIDRWQKGYTATSFNDGNRAENEAIKDKFNEKLGVTKAQEQAMLAGSMIRWDSIAAKPKSYDENGKAIKPKDYER